jgi:hypothetical protein
MKEQYFCIQQKKDTFVWLNRVVRTHEKMALIEQQPP